MSLLSSCQIEVMETQKQRDCTFCGAWTYERSELLPNNQYASVYRRTPDLVENQYGFAFNANGELVMRQNSGWCGTPPITTSDYPGKWQQEGNTVFVQSAYWGGPKNYRFTLLSVNDRELKIQTIY